MLKQVQHDGLRGIMASLLIATIAFLAASRAEAAHRVLPEGYRWGHCLLEVDGKAYISGRCAYLTESDGSFEIVKGHPDDEGGYFATVDLSERSAKGWWNEEEGAGHAQTPLGTLRRQGACWVNKHARICLRRN
jgi:hypothetical protein